MTSTDTIPVIVRLTNSTIAGAFVILAGASWPRSHVGQSLQPSPEPVRRTIAPVRMIAASDSSARKVTLRYVCADNLTASGLRRRGTDA